VQVYYLLVKTVIQPN